MTHNSMMSRQFHLRSEHSGAIAKRLKHAKIRFLLLAVSSINSLQIYILTTVEPTITAPLYNGHLSIAVTNEQSHPKFHIIELVFSGHLLNAASGHPFVVPY